MPENSLFYIPATNKYRLARGSIRLLLTLQLLLVLIIIAAVLLSNTHLRQVWLQHGLHHARVQAENLEASLTQNFQLLHMHARSLQLNGTTLQQQRTALYDLQQKLVYIRSLSLVDAQGRIQLSTNPDNEGLQPQLGQLLPATGFDLLRFARPWQGRDFAQGQQMHGQPEEQYAGVEFFPVLIDLPNAPGLTLLVAINSDYFINLVSSRAEQDTLQQSLYTDAGVLLFSTDPEQLSGSQYASARQLEHILSSLVGGGQWTDARGQQQLTGYRASKNYPWFVQARVSRHDTLQQWRKDSRRLWSSALVTMALMLLITGYLTYRVSRSLQAWERRQEAVRLAASVFLHSSDMTLITEEQQRVIAVNPSFEKNSGYSIKDVLGLQLGEFSLEQEPDPVYAQMREYAAKHGSWQGEVNNVRKDGTLMTCWLSVNAVQDSRGKTVNYVAVLRDLSRIRSDEEQIRKLSQAVEQSPSSIVITTLDAKIEYANPEFFHATGYAAEEVLGANPRILQSGLTPVNTYTDMWQSITNGDVWHGEFVNKRKNGSLYYERASVSPLLDHQGKISGYLGIKHDISAEKEAQQAMRLAASVIANTNEGVMICDDEIKIIDVNQAFTQITGYGREEVIGRKPSFLASENRNRQQHKELYVALSRQGHWQGEFWNRHKNGANYVVSSSINQVHDDSGKISHYISVFSDITELKIQQQNLVKQAHFDLLTGLPNRILLQDRLKQAMARARRQEHWLAVCFMDLDGFKAVNDTHGHEAGDELLLGVAQRLQQSIRTEDTAARLGGDEFVLLLEPINNFADCQVVMERVLSAIRQPLTLSNGAQAFVTGSMGVTIFPLDDSDSDQLLRHSDRAMYKAKQAGRDCYKLFGKVAGQLK